MASSIFSLKSHLLEICASDEDILDPEAFCIVQVQEEKNEAAVVVIITARFI